MHRLMLKSRDAVKMRSPLSDSASDVSAAECCRYMPQRLSVGRNAALPDQMRQGHVTGTCRILSQLRAVKWRPRPAPGHSPWIER